MINKETNTIPAGYIVILKTYENDADNPNTNTFSGLSKEEFEFVTELGKLFKSGGRDEKCLGNTDTIDTKETWSKLEHVFDEDKYPNLLNGFSSETPEDQWNTISDMIFEYIGTWCEDEYYRYVDSIECYYLEQPVTLNKIEL